MPNVKLSESVTPTGAAWFTPRRSLDRKVDHASGAATVEDVARWLLGAGRTIRQPGDLLHELSWRLVAAGIPLARTTVHIGTLHPQYLGVFARWYRATGRTDEATIAHGVRETDAYLRSPMRLVFEGKMVRRRLDSPDSIAEFPILAELSAEGITDYLAAPLNHVNRRYPVVAWATDRAGGFTEDDVALLEEIRPALAAVIEMIAARRTARGV